MFDVACVSSYVDVFQRQAGDVGVAHLFHVAVVVHPSYLHGGSLLRHRREFLQNQVRDEYWKKHDSIQEMRAT